MSKFDNYFLMKEEDVVEYIREKIDLYRDIEDLKCKEVGDGNINYVFRVYNDDKSIIVKQAGEHLRISEEMTLSTDRGRIEANILKIQNDLAKGYVPEVYLYDGTMCALVMEDMIGHKMMRTGLLEHEIYPKFAEQISDFMAKTLLLTTDIVMDHIEKKKRVMEFTNPELCDITEHLVYSEPFIDYNHRNNVNPDIMDFAQRELYDDEDLHVEVAKAKLDFLTNAQALIHGDLHTGSIFINKEHTFVFDPEFAFYGPIGYDVGNIIANMFFAWSNGDAQIEDKNKKKEFCDWALNSISQILDLFLEKFISLYKENVSDIMFKSDRFREHYISTVLRDTALVAGLESIRRTVGMANVKDLTTISDREKRALAEKRVIMLAKKYILNADKFKTGQDYRDAILEVVNMNL